MFWGKELCLDFNHGLLGYYSFRINCNHYNSIFPAIIFIVALSYRFTAVSDFFVINF